MIKPIIARVLFVGDKPSSKNLDPKVPFVGTPSYSRLLIWMAKMGIDVSGVFVLNKDCIDPEIPLFFNAVVALGKNASDACTKNNIEHFQLPHPSGLNRKLNDATYVKNILTECRLYLLRKQEVVPQTKEME